MGKGAGILKDTNGMQSGPYSPCFEGQGICAGEQVFLRRPIYKAVYSCQRVMTGVPGQLALRAVYTGTFENPEQAKKVPGPVVKDSGCSTWRFGPEKIYDHSTFSCCLLSSTTPKPTPKPHSCPGGSL